jgi:Rrf2 family protein
MITQYTRYALKALLHLAGRSREQPHPVAEIAEKANIPRKFLETILADLKRRGFVISTRGKRGGYRLARPAEQITFGELLRQLEGPIAMFPCASKTAYQACADCPDEAACSLRRVMIEARDRMASALDETTLASARDGQPGQGSVLALADEMSEQA